MTKSPNDKLQETVGKLYEKMELDAYAKGFAAGLEAGAEIVWAVTWLSAPEKDLLSDALRERAREEKATP